MAGSLTLLETPFPVSDPDAERLLEHSRGRAREGADRRERRIEAASSGFFLVAAAALAAAAKGGEPLSLSAALVMGFVYAAATRVRFEVGAGHTSPLQLVLVPMLVTLPPQTVPLLVAFAMTASIGWDVARRKRHPTRLLAAPGQAWHALGPAVVLLLAPVGSLTAEDAPILCLAFGAQVAIDLMTSTIVDRVGAGITFASEIRSASWVYASDALLMPPAALIAATVQRYTLAITLLLPLLLLLEVFARDRSRGLDRALELSQAYRGTALLLGDVVEADDAYTGSHSRDVVGMAIGVAERLGLDSRRRRNVEFAALLHDVGKIRIPKEIINSPNPLSPSERRTIEQHTIQGQDMLEGVGGVLAEVGRIVRASHEQFDGSGYPDGLEGEDIPIEARICSCCDAFSAMTTDRPYRTALSVKEAVQELRANAGSQFDPAVVAALIDVIDRH
jgi:HD-GYP domain-containing protein (c-di-GMP phosphodiesterase class II)